MATKAVRMGQSATAHSITVAELRARLETADRAEFDALFRAFSSDSRKGVQTALEGARKRIERREREDERLDALYRFQEALARDAGAALCVGLDEVGRGPLAGPLAVAGVVLPASPRIPGLDDSKKLAPDVREALDEKIRAVALACEVCFIPPADIDSQGMTACLRRAFRETVARIDDALPGIGLVLLDGNPLHIDSREKNIVKGDARCASIAAASIVAKVRRDAYMDEQALLYPEYGFESNKGYGTAEHMAALDAYGLSPIHRASFCTSVLQGRLF